MTCPKCGSQVSDIASLCGRCGALMRRDTAPKPTVKTAPQGEMRTQEFDLTTGLSDHLDKAVVRNRYAILIGTSYRGSGISNLPACRHDLSGMKKMLVQRFNYPAENVRVISESDVTKPNVESALHDLNDRIQLRADDQVLVYFSGHGASLPTNTGDGRTQGYLVTHDARIEGLARSCVSMRSIWEPLEQCRANQRLFICDACHSGHLADNKSIGVTSLLDAQMKELIAGTKRMSPRAAVQVITAGRRDEVVAAQAEDTRLSPFTHLMLERMDMLANEGSRFTAKSLGEWLQQHYPEFVREYSGGHVSEPLVENVCGSRGNFMFTPAG